MPTSQKLLAKRCRNIMLPEQFRIDAGEGELPPSWKLDRQRGWQLVWDPGAHRAFHEGTLLNQTVRRVERRIARLAAR